MGNDKGWQRRTDQWVQATHESRIRKEKRLAEKRKQERENAQADRDESKTKD